MDQFGRVQVRGPAPRGGAGGWARRVLGIGAEAPTALNLHGLVLGGRKAGTFHLYLDNVCVRRADGAVVPIWTEGRHTRFRILTESPAFKDVSVRAVPLPDA